LVLKYQVASRNDGTWALDNVDGFDDRTHFIERADGKRGGADLVSQASVGRPLFQRLQKRDGVMTRVSDLRAGLQVFAGVEKIYATCLSVL
jgi:hypothetical protein